MSETLTNHEMYLFFLLGLVIGSFLNTVIYRLPFMFGYEKGESAFKKLILPIQDLTAQNAQLPYPSITTSQLLVLYFSRVNVFIVIKVFLINIL